MPAVNDILDSQNISRLQGVLGIIGSGSSFSAARDTQSQLSVGGGIISSVGSFLESLTTPEGRKAREGFNLNRFSSELNRMNGLLTTSNFFVTIDSPKWLTGDINSPTIVGQATVSEPTDTFSKESNKQKIISTKEIFTSIPLLAHSASIPGLQQEIVNIKRHGYGPSEQVPTNIRFDNITFNFYCDTSGSIFNFFTKWSQNIVNFDYNSFGSKTHNGAFYHEVQYKDWYQTTLNLYVFSPAGSNFAHYIMYKGFPTHIGSVALNWREGTSLLTVPITFTFKTWKSGYLSEGKVDGKNLRNLTLADYLIRSGSVAQAISSFQRPRSIADVINVIGNSSAILRNIGNIF